MKKLITLILIVATAIACMALLPTAAEEAIFDETGMKTVYLSDNGDDLKPRPMGEVAHRRCDGEGNTAGSHLQANAPPPYDI